MPSVSLFELFFIFFYVGLFTIGGGLVAITLMQQMIVERGLVSAEAFYNMIAISESTPGPIGINMATYLGYTLYGVPGAIITTIGETLPSIVCILIIARFLSSFAETPIVKNVFVALRPASSGLITVATLNIFTLSIMHLPETVSALKYADTWKNLFDWKNLIFYLILLIPTIKLNLHPVILIVIGALFGVLFL